MGQTTNGTTKGGILERNLVIIQFNILKEEIMKKLPYLTTAMALSLLAFTQSASAITYSVTKNPFSDYAQADSYTPPTVVGELNPFIQDVSKNAAYIPPVFGSYTADTLNSGVLLTPNLVGTPPVYISPSTGATMGTGGSSSSSTGGTESSDSFYIPTTVTPNVPTDSTTQVMPQFTSIDGMVDSDNKIGHLVVEAAGIDFPVYEGTEESSILYGAGHFDWMSAWDGNVGLAGHNRGVNNNFGEIHNLQQGEIIKYTTIYGTRTYAVESITKIYCTDFSLLDVSTDNRISLVTCVADDADYRWVVQGVEVVF